MMNIFSVTDRLRLIDLPGYGYSKTSKKQQSLWKHNILFYLEHRRCLSGIFIIIDIRHPLKPMNQFMIDLAVSRDIPYHIVLTKADKLSALKQNNMLKEAKKLILNKNGSMQLFSSTSCLGVSELHRILLTWAT